MYNDYLRKILPIPIVDIEVKGYKYRITTYSSVIDEKGVKATVTRRLKNNKRIKSFGDWWFKNDDRYYKQLIVEFVNEH